jgi:hypothetical protein
VVDVARMSSHKTTPPGTMCCESAQSWPIANASGKLCPLYSTLCSLVACCHQHPSLPDARTTATMTDLQCPPPTPLPASLSCFRRCSRTHPATSCSTPLPVSASGPQTETTTVSFMPQRRQVLLTASRIAIDGTASLSVFTSAHIGEHPKRLTFQGQEASQDCQGGRSVRARAGVVFISTNS